MHVPKQTAKADSRQHQTVGHSNVEYGSPLPRKSLDALQAQPKVPYKELLQMQRQQGNRHVNQVLQQSKSSTAHRQPVVQAKLTIGPVGDRYEQEADRVAQQVVKRLNAPPQITQLAESDQVAPIKASNVSPPIRFKTLPTLATSGQSSNTATPGLETAIQQASGHGGQPLPPTFRGPVEQEFGADFSDVRVHTDVRADQLNRAMQARAFTTGQSIFFRKGEYQPDARPGQTLIAHELAHVVQQGMTGTSIIQRKVGFEIEVPNWISAKKTVHESQSLTYWGWGSQRNTANLPGDIHPRDHLVTGDLIPNPGGIPYRFESLKKKDKIIKANGFTLEADESNQGGLTNVEFVTDAFEDTRAGGVALSNTLYAITNLADEMRRASNQTAAGCYLLASYFRGYGNASPEIVLFPSNNMTAVMQVTAGINLSQIATLMTQMGGVPIGEAPATTANLQMGRFMLGGALGSVHGPNPTGNGPIQAAQAIINYRAAHPADTRLQFLHFQRTQQPNNALQLGSNELQGLISLIYQYLVTADQALTGYAKTIAPLMARTQFDTLFDQLPVDEQTYLRENNANNFINLVMEAVHITHAGINQVNDVFSQGLYHNFAAIPGINVNALAGLTREDWLRGIANHVDYLTAANFNSNPALGLPLPQPKKDDLESLGSYGNATEAVGTNRTQAPLFEIRSMGQIATLNEWYPRAMDTFIYLRDLNDGAGTFYQDTYSNLPANEQANLQAEPSLKRWWSRWNLKSQLERQLRP